MYNFEDDILNAVAESSTKGVGGVGGRGPVQDDRMTRRRGAGRRKMVLNLVPFRVRRHRQAREGSRCCSSTTFITTTTTTTTTEKQRQAELTAVINVEVVVSRKVGVEDEFLDAMRGVE